MQGRDCYRWVSALQEFDFKVMILKDRSEDYSAAIIVQIGNRWCLASMCVLLAVLVLSHVRIRRTMWCSPTQACPLYDNNALYFASQRNLYRADVHV
ncbi:hypothetical protein Tco_0494585 [Tanacetum coccineum]